MAKPLEMFLFVLSMIGPVGVGLVVAVPIAGAIVRLRANYTPKGLQLDQEDVDANQASSQARVGPAIDGVVNMLRRIHRIEGWTGLYKGFVPALISTILITLWAILTIPGHAKYRPCSQVYVPSTSILRGLLYGMGALIVAIPYEIIFNRVVCTPHRLPWFKPMEALRVILTPYERRKPWMLYFTPGLLAARVLILIWIVAVAQFVRAKLLPSLSRGLSSVHDTDDQNRMTKHLNPTKLAIFLVFSMASTAFLCPLEVLATRLSVQRNHPRTEADSTIDGISDSPPDYIGEEEDVIALRSEEDPYLSLVNCAKLMVNEEGVGCLFRAWWLTMLAVTFGSFT